MKVPSWLYNTDGGKLFESQPELDAAVESGVWFDTPANVPEEKEEAAESTGPVAVMKEGRERALKVCDSQAEADSWVLENVPEEDWDAISFEDR